jgi:26S proteasome regulatory subunit N11
LIRGLNRHYYSLGIDYNLNELEQKMLMNLNKQQWQDDLRINRASEQTKYNHDSIVEISGWVDAYHKVMSIRYIAGLEHTA